MEHLRSLWSLILPILLATILVTFSLEATAIDSTSKQLRSSFGDFCNKTVRCNSREFLTCLNETCQCLKPDMMTFDPEINSCVTIAGESCRYTVFSNSADEDQKSWTEEVKCLTNAKCNSEGICDCDTNFFEVSNGTCQPKGLYGNKCQSNDQCRGDLHFKCTNGLCNCNRDISIFSPDTNSCVGLAEQSCLFGNCVTNAKCDDRPTIPDSYRRYQHNPNPSHNICKCETGTTISKERFCLVPFKGECQAFHPSSNCFPTLKCQDGICVCPNDDYQYYDENLNSCITLVGGPCGPFSNSTDLRSSAGLDCVSLSECTGNDLSTKCQCIEGYVTSKDRKCELGFGQFCNTGLVCGKLQGLFCINGKCGCKDDLQIYDTTASECRGLVDSLCSDTEGPSCIKGAICVPQKTSSKFGQGICMCNDKEGYIFNSLRRTCDQNDPIKTTGSPRTMDRRSHSSATISDIDTVASEEIGLTSDDERPIQ